MSRRQPFLKRVLVTGANGFVGKALCQALSVSGINFIPAVRQDSGIVSAPFVIGDIGANTDWSMALRGVDVVVHLASRVHVLSEKSANPLSAFRAVNTEGTLNLARQAVASGVSRFVFVSTVKVFGEGAELPYTEASPSFPENDYALSKWEAECGLRELALESGMEVVVLRPPLVYGPGVSANFLRMMQILNRGLPLPFGRVRNLRSLVFVDNLVSLIVLCMEHPMAANRDFLVSDGEDLSTSELLCRVGKELRTRTMLIPVPVCVLGLVLSLLGKRDVARRLLGSLRVDCSRARDLLGWSPPVSVDEGIKRTVNDFLKSMSRD